MLDKCSIILVPLLQFCFSLCFCIHNINYCFSLCYCTHNINYFTVIVMDRFQLPPFDRTIASFCLRVFTKRCCSARHASCSRISGCFKVLIPTSLRLLRYPLERELQLFLSSFQLSTEYTKLRLSISKLLSKALRTSSRLVEQVQVLYECQ